MDSPGTQGMRRFGACAILENMVLSWGAYILLASSAKLEGGMRLSELDPRWIGAGGDGITRPQRLEKEIPIPQTDKVVQVAFWRSWGFWDWVVAPFMLAYLVWVVWVIWRLIWP